MHVEICIEYKSHQNFIGSTSIYNILICSGCHLVYLTDMSLQTNGLVVSEKTLKNIYLTAPELYLCHLCLFAYSGVQHVLTIWVTRRVSYQRRELLTLREHVGSPPGFGEVCVAHLFSFLCCAFVFYLSPSCVLCTQCCQCLWIVHSLLPLHISLTFI